MRVLVTGFEPFAGARVNPSWEAVRDIQGPGLRTLRVPVVYRRAWRVIRRELERGESADALLICGLARGRDAINVEALAMNRADAPWQTDNAGRRARGAALVAGAPDALFATAPVRRIAQAINAAGVPALVSYYGGAYVSNATLYEALLWTRRTRRRMAITYLHVPASPEMVVGTAIPSLPVAAIRLAIEAAVAALGVQRKTDAPLRRWPSVLPELV